eukprot:scaffold254_cov129-Isochrysis_galbana.AAC.3
MERCQTCRDHWQARYPIELSRRLLSVQAPAHLIALVGAAERILRDCETSTDKLFPARLLGGRQRIGKVVMSAREAPRESKLR